MSRFDEEPDGDPHGECALEIHRLEARIAELEASVLKITADCNAVVCGKSDRITELEAEVARLRVDAAIGAVVWKYIDRMNDVVPSDPAERILCEFCHAVQPVMDAAKESA